MAASARCCCASHLTCRVVGAVGVRPDKPSANLRAGDEYVSAMQRATRAAFWVRFGAGAVRAAKGEIIVDYSSVESMMLPAYQALHLAVLGEKPPADNSLDQIERDVRASLSSTPSRALPRVSSVGKDTRKMTKEEKEKKKFVCELKTNPFPLVAFLALLSHFSLTRRYATSNIETSQRLSHPRDMRPKKATFQLVMGSRAGNFLSAICEKAHFCLQTVASLKVLVWWVQKQPQSKLRRSQL